MIEAEEVSRVAGSLSDTLNQLQTLDDSLVLLGGHFWNVKSTLECTTSFIALPAAR